MNNNIISSLKTELVQWNSCLSCLWYRVGIETPTIEVRFEHLTVDAEAYVGSRALPTLFNFTVNFFEVFDWIKLPDCTIYLLRSHFLLQVLRLNSFCNLCLFLSRCCWIMFTFFQVERNHSPFFVMLVELSSLAGNIWILFRRLIEL